MINNLDRDTVPRIMVVDDEKDILRIIKRDLDAFMVETFTNGWNALEALDSHPRGYYDLVLTDIRMPRMNGFELYRKIKEKNPSMKIVFITAFEINKEEFTKVLPSIDVKDFIIKPISMTNLRNKLNEVLKGIE